MSLSWRVRLAEAARRNYATILNWTAEHFGKKQARVYEETLKAALRDLVQGPSVTGCRRREDIGHGIYALHVARKGRKGRHFVMFRVDSDNQIIDVLRLLHDSMDLPRHFPPADQSDG